MTVSDVMDFPGNMKLTYSETSSLVNGKSKNSKNKINYKARDKKDDCVHTCFYLQYILV